MRRILERGVMDATVVELVLALGTAFALYGTLQQVGWRLFATEQFGVAGLTVTSAQLLAPFFAFLVLAALLMLTISARLRAEDAQWLEIEAEEAEEAVEGQ